METRECYVIKENDLLGTNSDWVSVLYMRRKFKKKGVKRIEGSSNNTGEEMWRRIIAKYISSIRDAFMGIFIVLFWVVVEKEKKLATS